MRHTLLQHFQGALFGGWIGQVFTDDHPADGAWQILVNLLVDSLSQNPGPIDWQKVWANWERSPGEQNKNYIPSLSQVFAGLLPIVLFYHENPEKLQQELIQADHAMENQWGKDLGLTEKQSLHRQIMINNLANLIAGLLQEKYNLSQTFDQQAIFTLLFSQLSAIDPLYQQLLLLQNLLIAGESLHRAIALLETNGKHLEKEIGFDYQRYTPILLALYCFFDTPNNSQIAMQRGLLCPNQQEVIPLLGILLGTYHSHSRIPIPWQIDNILPQQSSHMQIKSPSPDQIASLQIPQIKLMAEKLWLAWSGFYLPHNNTDGSLYNTNIAIASCNIMRPRPFR
jgi:hypothetical protein